MTASLDRRRFVQRFPSFDGSCMTNLEFQIKNNNNDDFGGEKVAQTGSTVKSYINKSFHYYRYLVVMLGGLSIGFMSLLRLNITVAILNMVNQTEIYIESHGEVDDFELEKYFGTDYVEIGEFKWNNEIQQTIISYYMIAYTLPQLFTTKLALDLGFRYSIPLCLILCALSNILIPPIAYYGWEYVTLLRILNGLGASAMLPVVFHLVEVYMPNDENSQGLNVVLFIQSIVFTLTPLISAYLSSIHWQWAFYIPSIAALLLCFIWILLISDEPSKCKLISESELSKIKFMSSVQIASSDTKANEKEGIEVPWTSALKFKSFYALTTVWILYCSSFGSFTFLISSYLYQVLDVPILENGLLCFLMQLGCIVSVLWPQPIIRLLQNRYNCSITFSRRIVSLLIGCTTIATWLYVALFHRYQVVLFAINRLFQLSTDTLVTSTIMSQYSKIGTGSVVYSVINSIGNLSTVFFCMTVGYCLDRFGESIECWSWIFISMCFMEFLIVVLYSTIINSDPIELENEKADSNGTIV